MTAALHALLAGAAAPAGGDTDPNFADVSLLLPLSSGYTDLSSNAHSITDANVTIDSSVQFFGLDSAAFNGSNSTLTLPTDADFAFPGDFTVEFNFRQTAGANQGVICLSGLASEGGLVVRMNGSNRSISILAAFTADYGGAPSDSYSLSTNHHFAISRSGTSMKLFIDGVTVATLTNSFSFTQAAGVIGTERSGNFFTGRLGNVRITKGVARYTADFTPPAAPWPTS